MTYFSSRGIEKNVCPFSRTVYGTVLRVCLIGLVVFKTRTTWNPSNEDNKYGTEQSSMNIQ